MMINKEKAVDLIFLQLVKTQNDSFRKQNG